jgi:hypothetical protein
MQKNVRLECKKCSVWGIDDEKILENARLKCKKVGNFVQKMRCLWVLEI